MLVLVRRHPIRLLSPLLCLRRVRLLGSRGGARRLLAGPAGGSRKVIVAPPALAAIAALVIGAAFATVPTGFLGAPPAPSPDSVPASQAPGAALKALGDLPPMLGSASLPHVNLVGYSFALGSRKSSRLGASRSALERVLGAVRSRLELLGAQVSSAGELTSAERAALMVPVSGALGAVAGFDERATAASSPTELSLVAASARAFGFARVVPQVLLARAAYEAGNIEAQLQQVETLAERAVQRSGRSALPALRLAEAGLASQVASADGATAGVASSLLAASPAGHPPAKTSLLAARNELLATRAALREARHYLEKIVYGLRGR